MTTDLPPAARYLEKLTAALGDLALAERTEVVDELRNHIADATAAGRPLDEVLTALGPVDQLARAYKVELLLNPKAPGPRRSDRWLRLLALVALGSIPVFIVVVVLGSIGLAFTASGLAVFIAGIAASVGTLPGWVNMDVPPWVAIALGPALAVIGVLALWGLVAYVTFVARLVRKVVPGTTAS